ncbi:hypothetical protein TAMA11512_17860 [Selenomonas sp. TAMA-11512]|uniref:hypothetical protein n=1 Tax=Selenomonas sp. TAMA-11512 TaxID=3095337 RepID=UPI003084AE49|nr:hypothetical protein TAMA11512_17860 [Selenomonas sp. TAMA-11512]
MQKKDCMLFAAIFAIFLLLVSARDILLNPPTDISEVDAMHLMQNLNSFDEPTNWTYLDADYDYHEDTLPAELAVPDAPWKPYDFPKQPPLHAEDQHSMWLRLTLPADVEPAVTRSFLIPSINLSAYGSMTILSIPTA